MMKQSVTSGFNLGFFMKMMEHKENTGINKICGKWKSGENKGYQDKNHPGIQTGGKSKSPLHFI